MSITQDEVIDHLRKCRMMVALRYELGLKFFAEKGWDVSDMLIYNQATEGRPVLSRIETREESKWICRQVAHWRNETWVLANDAS